MSDNAQAGLEAGARLIKKLVDIVHDIETEQIDAELLADHPPAKTCADCANCVGHGHNSYQCSEREGNESGQGESNVMEWDEACPAFKARLCPACGDPMTMNKRHMCEGCLDLRDRLRMDSREDGGVVR